MDLLDLHGFAAYFPPGLLSCNGHFLSTIVQRETG